jgi:cytochrome c peroxidase
VAIGAVWHLSSLQEPPVIQMEAPPSASSNGNLPQVREAIVQIMEDSQQEDGSSMLGSFIRLAWHSSGTYQASDKSGGSNGARQRHEPESKYGNNAGLDLVRASLEPVKEAFPDLSYADLYTFAGVVAVEEAGGPPIPFAVGREDFTDGSTSDPQDRLPDADKGAIPRTTNHIRQVFNRMGFNDQEIVALMGAHAVGRCYPTRSGYWGPWSNSETTFSNEYFRLLLEEKWTPKTTHKGEPWTGPAQYEDSSGNLMMLPTDMVMIWDEKFRRHVRRYAADEDEFFKDFASAFAKLLTLGVPVAAIPKELAAAQAE